MWHFDTNKFLPHAKNYRDARKTHLLPTWALKLQYWSTLTGLTGSVGIDKEKMSQSQLESHLHCIHWESIGCRAAWSARQQGHLCVRASAVADGAVVLPGPSGEVPSQPPSPPPPLKLLLYLEKHGPACSALLKSTHNWLWLAERFLPLRSGSSRVQPPRTPYKSEEKEGQWALFRWLLEWVQWALTCVDDSASSAKVQILNTELFTSTGRKTNRM